MRCLFDMITGSTYNESNNKKVWEREEGKKEREKAKFFGKSRNFSHKFKLNRKVIGKKENILK